MTKEMNCALQIKVMPFLQKKGNRVAKGAIEFTGENPLSGFQLVGFTICDDAEKGLFVLFPSSIIKHANDTTTKPYFFLRPSAEGQLDTLESAILDVYESMTGGASAFNSPRITKAAENKPVSEVATSGK